MPEVTAAECQYLSEVGEQLNDVGNALSTMGELTGRADLFSDEWIVDMALQFVLIRFTREDALALDPPDGLNDVHTIWLSTLDTLVDATDLMGEGIDEFDADKIDASSELILEATAQLVEMTSMIEEFGDSRSGQCP
jgi:hypothetical protein